MTLPANIRVNVRAPFPARVQGSAFIQVTKANGVWTISPNYLALNPAASINGSQIIALYDTLAKTWSYVSAAQFISASAGSYRTITYTGNVTVLPTDVVLILNKSTSGPSSILLPNAATRGGTPVTVKDMTGDAFTNNVTFVPAIGETIDGFSASAAAANGVAVIGSDYASKTLSPFSSGGWYVT